LHEVAASPIGANAIQAAQALHELINPLLDQGCNAFAVVKSVFFILGGINEGKFYHIQVMKKKYTVPVKKTDT